MKWYRLGVEQNSLICALNDLDEEEDITGRVIEMLSEKFPDGWKGKAR